MTEEQVQWANELIFARKEIEEFLSAREPDSAFVKSYLDSQYEYQVKEGKRLPKATTVSLGITDAKSCLTAYDEEPDTLASWAFPRRVLERALQGQLAVIAEELRTLGVGEP